MIEYIIAFLIITYTIFIIVGFIFITYGIFNLSTDTVPKNIKDAVLTNYIKGKTLTATYTKSDQDVELAALPDIPTSEPTGKLMFTLSNDSIIASKVTLISIWVFIIIGIMFGIFALIH
jgi:hypothetical protein